MSGQEIKWTIKLWLARLPDSWLDDATFLRTVLMFSGTWDADRHTEADSQRQRREHQEAAGDASDQGRGQGGGGQGPSADADGGAETGQSGWDQCCWSRFSASVNVNKLWSWSNFLFVKFYIDPSLPYFHFHNFQQI